MLNRIFEDIGEKMKRLAMVLFVIEAVLCVLTGMLFIAFSRVLIVYGIFIIGLGPLIAWISSWPLYGLGELIDKTCENERHNRELLKIMKTMKQG